MAVTTGESATAMGGEGVAQAESAGASSSPGDMRRRRRQTADRFSLGEDSAVRRRAAYQQALKAETNDVSENALDPAAQQRHNPVSTVKPAGGAAKWRALQQSTVSDPSPEAFQAGRDVQEHMVTELAMAEDETVDGDVLYGAAPVRPIRPLPPVTAVVAPGKRGSFKKIGDHAMPPTTAASLVRTGISSTGIVHTAYDDVATSTISTRGSAIDTQGIPAILPLLIQVTAVIQQAWLASSKTACGLMSGAAALELALLSQAREEPLSPFILYADASLHFGRIYLWGGLVSAVGAGLVILRRQRSKYYTYYPYSRILSWALILFSVMIITITVAMRQSTFFLGSAATRAVLPYRVPIESEAYQSIIRGTGPYGDPVPAAVLLRALFCVASLLLSYLPAADEPPELPASLAVKLYEPVAAAMGARMMRPHMLAGDYAEALDGGASVLMRGSMFTIGFGMPRLAPSSAPDGKPPPIPIPESAMSRNAYAFRAAVVVCFLALDSFSGLLSNSLFWEIQFFSGVVADENSGDGFERVLPDIMQLIIFIVCRVIVAAQLFSTLAQTTAFKLGRLTPLIKHFRRPFIIQGVAFAISLVMIGIRVVSAADASQPLLLLGNSSLAIAYSVFLFIHLPMTAIYQIATLDALRRLARSEYYIDNERAAGF